MGVFVSSLMDSIWDLVQTATGRYLLALSTDDLLISNLIFGVGGALASVQVVEQLNRANLGFLAAAITDSASVTDRTDTDGAFDSLDNLRGFDDLNVAAEYLTVDRDMPTDARFVFE